MMRLDSDITQIKGIGEKTAECFYKLNIHTVQDLLYYFPRKYDLYSEPVEPSEDQVGERIAVCGIILREGKPVRVRNLTILNTWIRVGGQGMKITFYNMPYLRNALKCNRKYVFCGVLKQNHTGFYMEQPKLCKPEEYDAMTQALQPVYGTTEGLSCNAIRKAVLASREQIPFLRDCLPENLIVSHALPKLNDAVENMHFPQTIDAYVQARKRFSYDEFVAFLLSLKMMKADYRYMKTIYPMIPVAYPNRVLERLPYQLTAAQKRTYEEIVQDLCTDRVMNRLIQGDVGSGKTIIAFLALLMCAGNGYQAALMAPTEVLAKQHFTQFTQLLQQNCLPFRCVLLTGSTSASARKEILPGIADGSVQIVIGTHAIFQDSVRYHALALAITDEQHRFGVKQREQLVHKGVTTNVLVMSATPIPRSLAMILYSDMNLSVIDELPVGRKPIKNCVVDESYRETAHRFLLKEIASGRQAYVICPMIEDNEETDLVSVTEYYDRLQASMPETVRIGLLHGRMKNTEKNRIMEAFAAGNIDILVATTVVEVGINVPNATVMMIENAERFGLATLHQLRGRVGRGAEQSYCIFMNGSKKEKENARLNILLKSNDGFEIANEDLKLRGPGELTGVSQSGDFPFQIADIYRDADILRWADEDTDRIMEDLAGGREAEYREYLDYLQTVQNNKVDFRSI